MGFFSATGIRGGSGEVQENQIHLLKKSSFDIKLSILNSLLTNNQTNTIPP